MTDPEDIGGIMKSGRGEDEPGKATSGPVAVDFTNYSKNKEEPTPAAALREIVPNGSHTYNSSPKQCYTVVGTRPRFSRWCQDL